MLLPYSAISQLLILSTLPTGSGGKTVRHVARSYDGYDWEIAAGGALDTMRTTITCSARMSLVCEACVTGGYRLQAAVESSTEDECRNTIIVELVKAGKGVTSDLQKMDNDVLRAMVPAATTQQQRVTGAERGCIVNLPAIPGSGGDYRLEAVGGNGVAARPTAKASASQFLQQATFGATRALLRNLASGGDGDVQSWITAQKALPPTSHRAYVRRRSNPRLASPGATVPMGPARRPCLPGSRWHNHAFNTGDRMKTLVVADAASGKKTLSVDGVLLTDVPAFTITPSTIAPPYVICDVVENVGGEIKLGGAGACTTTGLMSGGNPAISGPDPPLTQNFATNAMIVLTDLVDAFGGSAGLKVLTSMIPSSCVTNADCVYVGCDQPDLTTCSSGICHTGTIDSRCTGKVNGADPPDGVAPGWCHDGRRDVRCPKPCSFSGPVSFLGYKSKYYRQDYRVVAIRNTLAEPADLEAGSSFQAVASCPAVQQTFLNEATCVRRSACNPAKYSSHALVLDAATLRKFYTISGKYVYRVANLKIGSGSGIKEPCDVSSSRWKKLAGACTPSNGGSETTLDAATKATFVQALQSSTDPNPWVNGTFLW